ncbi:MAG: calcium/sodium antiporter [Clostridiales bacterium]|nr:calcium/sodium antiporter [Candidatus Equinaster intestinalis]
MEIFVTVLLFIVGIVLVVKGGDWFVDAASWIAEVSGIPKLIIGATVVSVATTLPEMLVSVMAAVDGKVDMSIGNAVGSVTANIGLIMALSLIFMPSVIKRRDYLTKSILMLVAAAVIVACGLTGSISLWFCVGLLVIFGIFIYENVASARRNMLENKNAEKEEVQKDGKTVFINIAKFIVGAAGIVVGARLLVDNASELARLFGISERIIGVTIVAVGTSLPELITTLTAIRKKQSDLSVGNIIGANIMDLTLIMPLSSIISGKALPVESMQTAILDLPAALVVGAIAVVPALIQKKFSRWQGITLLSVYIIYLILTCFVMG